MAFREFLDWCNERAGVSMTDNEIVKALECMATNDLYNGDMQTASICLHAKETMERQKAEIERLKGWDRWIVSESHAPIIKKARAEAIKEFAERLKPILFNYYDSDIDNLVKEMVGDNE